VTITIPKETFEHNLYDSSHLQVKIPPEKWAPALWAGSEGLELTFIGVKWIVTAIDLDDRKIFLTRITP